MQIVLKNFEITLPRVHVHRQWVTLKAMTGQQCALGETPERFLR